MRPPRLPPLQAATGNMRLPQLEHRITGTPPAGATALQGRLPFEKAPLPSITSQARQTPAKESDQGMMPVKVLHYSSLVTNHHNFIPIGLVTDAQLLQPRSTRGEETSESISSQSLRQGSLTEEQSAARALLGGERLASRYRQKKTSGPSRGHDQGQI